MQRGSSTSIRSLRNCAYAAGRPYVTNRRSHPTASVRCAKKLPLSDPCRETTIWFGTNYHLLRGIDEQRFAGFDDPFAIVVRLLLTLNA
jgi:hypothetical protein